MHNNNSLSPQGSPGHDKLGIVRPDKKSVKKFADLYEPHKEVSIDEAMIKFTGRSSIKQYYYAYEAYKIHEESKYTCSLYLTLSLTQITHTHTTHARTNTHAHTHTCTHTHTHTHTNYYTRLQIFCHLFAFTLSRNTKHIKVWVLADNHNGSFQKLQVYILGMWAVQRSSLEKGIEGLHTRHHHVFLIIFTGEQLVHTKECMDIYGCGTARKDRKGFPELLKSVQLNNFSSTVILLVS